MKRIEEIKEEIEEIKEEFKNLDISIRSKKFSKAKIWDKRLDELTEKINRKEMKDEL